MITRSICLKYPIPNAHIATFGILWIESLALIPHFPLLCRMQYRGILARLLISFEDNILLFKHLWVAKKVIAMGDLFNDVRTMYSPHTTRPPHQYWLQETRNQMNKSHNAPAPYPTMHHSEQKCAIFCSEWCIVWYETGALWDFGQLTHHIRPEVAPLVKLQRPLQLLPTPSCAAWIWNNTRIRKSVQCRYNVVSFLQNTPNSSPVRAMYGESLVSTNFSLGNAWVTAILYENACYIAPRYGGT